MASAEAVGPGRVLSLVILLALFGAATTHALGLHAVFGGFVVGLTVGWSARVRERTRAAIEDFVTNVFAPVFFASVGLRVDFATSFDARLCVLVFVVATIPKLVGRALGARLGGMQWRQATAVGFGMNARGAMGIILAEIARGSGLLRDSMFVALVVMSLLTSLTSGPAMKWLLYREEAEEDVVTLLRRGAFVAELHATTPSEAITELVRSLGSLLTGMKRAARSAVIERELVAPTGLGDEVAIPHAALEGLTRPLLALGIAPRGIDFDAPDGRPARVVFLLLIPPKAYESEVRILASIARATYDARAPRGAAGGARPRRGGPGAHPQREEDQGVDAPAAAPRARGVGERACDVGARSRGRRGLGARARSTSAQSPREMRSRGCPQFRTAHVLPKVGLATAPAPARSPAPRPRPAPGTSTGRGFP